MGEAAKLGAFSAAPVAAENPVKSLVPRAQRQTVLMVTHSISESLLLSDRVLVMTPRPGRICLDLPVSLPRPRVEEMRYTKEFGEMAKEIKATL